MKFKNYTWEKIVPKIISLSTFCLNYFTEPYIYNKLKKDPRIEQVPFKSIRGIQRKELLSPPRKGWDALGSSLELHGYDPKKFNYIELNENNHIIEGKCRLCLLAVIYKNPLHKIEVKVYNLDIFKIKIEIARRRLKFNFICICIILSLILLLI